MQAARTFLTQRGVYGSRVRVFQAPSLTTGLRFRKGTFNLIFSSANLDGRLDATPAPPSPQPCRTTSLRPAARVFFDDSANAAARGDASSGPAPTPGKWTTNYGDNGNTGASDETLNSMSQGQ